jgi:hypothetical protein
MRRVFPLDVGYISDPGRPFGIFSFLPTLVRGGAISGIAFFNDRSLP